MKYIILSFLFLGIASCVTPTPSNESSRTNSTPNIDVGGVRVSDSGISVTNESGNVSIGANGSLNMTNESGSVSVQGTGTTMTSGSNTMTIWNGSVSVGTGMKIGTQSTGDMEKDPEVEGITQDIDKIFDDIGKEGK